MKSGATLTNDADTHMKMHDIKKRAKPVFTKALYQCRAGPAIKLSKGATLITRLKTQHRAVPFTSWVRYTGRGFNILAAGKAFVS
jgi:hypothetical protein